MVSCDKSNYGCQGGYLDKEWYFLESAGTVSEACWPYASGSGVAPKCRSTCVDNSPMTFYKSITGSLAFLGDINTLKHEIFTNGPVEGAFTVY